MSVGIVVYFVRLWRAEIALNEKGHSFTVLMFGLFAVISSQKAVRDRLENIPVTDIFIMVFAGLALFYILFY